MALRKWALEIDEKRPPTLQERLRKELAEAVRNEDYERAARLRDEIRDLGGEGSAMTELLYQTDSYLREFDAVVAAAEATPCCWTAPAFFPGGGGQMADKGTLRWDDQSARRSPASSAARARRGCCWTARRRPRAPRCGARWTGITATA